MTQNWAQTPFGSPFPQGNGGDLQPWWRDALDFNRSMWNKTPEAEYPDGYLGTFRTRRDDRLLDSLKNRVNQRSYQRGVHKGERIDQADYIWPAAWNPQLGLMAEAAGVRQAPVDAIANRLPPAGASMFPRGANSLLTLNRTPREVDPQRVLQLRRLMPSWR